MAACSVRRFDRHRLGMARFLKTGAHYAECRWLPPGRIGIPGRAQSELAARAEAENGGGLRFCYGNRTASGLPGNSLPIVIRGFDRGTPALRRVHSEPAYLVTLVKVSQPNLPKSAQSLSMYLLKPEEVRHEEIDDFLFALGPGAADGRNRGRPSDVRRRHGSGFARGCCRTVGHHFREVTCESSGTKLLIPYADIQTFEYSTEVTRHLGVLPAIGVGLVKMRRHRHYFRISYRGASDVSQIPVFEVPKHVPRTLRAVLEARAPQTYKPCALRAGRN